MIENRLRLIALIPHKDALKESLEYRRKLFEHGFSGSYSFPLVIPLIITKKPYTLAELKQTALSMKKMILSNNADGKYISQKTDSIDILPGFLIGGPSFDFSLDESALKKDDAALPRFVLGLTAIRNDTDKMNFEETHADFEPKVRRRREERSGTNYTEETFLRFVRDNPAPLISFRACSVANMIYSTSEDGAYSWEIGHPIWLPSSSKGKRNG
jgi:hypothetical protein